MHLLSVQTKLILSYIAGQMPVGQAASPLWQDRKVSFKHCDLLFVVVKLLYMVVNQFPGNSGETVCPIGRNASEYCVVFHLLLL